jgi:hypothetical protein
MSNVTPAFLHSSGSYHYPIMPEPLSIATSCITLVATIGRCAHAVTIFVREVRDARGDLEMISRELHSLTTILDLLGDDISKPSSNTLPPNLVTHIGLILKNCDGVIVEIERSLVKHQTSRLRSGGHWTLGGGKDDMTKFRSNLEAHKSALELALDMVTMTVSRETKKDTAEIRHHTAVLPDIKNDTAQILEEIARLRARLPVEHNHSSINIVFQRFLDESTSYAETVVDEGTVSELSELPGSSLVLPTFGRRENLDSPVPYSDFTFYPPDRDGRAKPPRQRQTLNPVTYVPRDGTPSPDLRLSGHYNSRPTDKNSSAFSRLSLGDDRDFEKSQLSLSVDRDFEKGRHSPTSSHRRSLSSKPISINQQYRRASGTTVENVGPTLKPEFQNHLRRPDQWNWVSWNHKTHTGSMSLSQSEFWTHRYTAMTRAPSYLAEVDFKLRQQDGYFRETMLIVVVHYPPMFEEAEFNTRFVTTLESITEAIAATPKICGTPSSGFSWWATVVVCLLHNETTQTQYAFTRHGMFVHCDADSEHCGIAPHTIPDEERKIYAHLWEHTTSRTKLKWNRRGMPEYFEEGETPLQLIQCQYTSKARRPDNLGDEEHVLPFIRMLGAHSCVVIAAGEKISKSELFDAYMTTKNKLSDIRVVDPMQRSPGAVFQSSFTNSYGGVPTKVYSSETNGESKQEKPSVIKRFGSMFR